MSDVRWMSSYVQTGATVLECTSEIYQVVRKQLKENSPAKITER